MVYKMEGSPDIDTELQTRLQKIDVALKESGWKFKDIYTPISLQNKFASLVKKIELIKQNQATAEINTLFDALMQKAFKSELIKDD